MSREGWIVPAIRFEKFDVFKELETGNFTFIRSIMRTRNADSASKSATPKKTPPKKSPAAKRTTATNTRATKKNELSPAPDSNPDQSPRKRSFFLLLSFIRLRILVCEEDETVSIGRENEKKKTRLYTETPMFSGFQVSFIHDDVVIGEFVFSFMISL